MKSKETCTEKCEFTVHPCNFEVEIKEIKPFFVYSGKCIILDLKVINHFNSNNIINIESKPNHGKILFLKGSNLIYKSINRFSGLDMFQILIEDEYGGKCTQTILIHVI